MLHCPYLYTPDNVRLTLASSRGGQPLNWLFLPGGPGADARYFSGLVEHLALPGNVWLVDLPGNGDHQVKGIDYDVWFDVFLPTLRLFPNTVLVGHSFGGMLPLLHIECESILKGFVILNAAPCLWREAAVAYAQQFDVPDLSEPMARFTGNPNQETFDAALLACMPYYFHRDNLEEGTALLTSIPFAYQAAAWGVKKMTEMQYTAQWIPEKLPTLIVNAEYDCIVPYTLFANDHRFDRPNIQRAFIQGAGHVPWVEKPDEVKALFDTFVTKIHSV